MTDISLDKTLPANLEAERSVLGAILLDDSAIYPASEVLVEGDFYLESHRKIFARMLAMVMDSRAIDIITLKDDLRRRDELEACGGPAYLASLTEGLPRCVNVGYYARIVRQKASLRRLIQIGNEAMMRGYQDEENPASILESVESALFKVASREVRGGFRKADELVSTAYKEIEAACNRKTEVTGLPTGLKGLDSMTAGLHPSDLIIIAGRPSLGKTSLSLNIACNAGIRCDKNVAIFSLESDGVELTKMRMLASEAEVDGRKLRTGWVNREDWSKLGRAAGAIAQAGIWVSDDALTMTQIRAAANRLHMQHGLDLIVIDYMQLMLSGERQRGENRTQEVTAISRGCKALAKELRVPVIAISQLNRAPEHAGKGRRPQLSDLRESGAIEQDADLVIFIHREEVHNPTEENDGTAELIIGKQRNGPTGSLNVAFLKQYCKFADLWQEGNLYQ